MSHTQIRTARKEQRNKIFKSSKEDLKIQLHRHFHWKTNSIKHTLFRPNMLWKKESSAPDALYVDLFKLCGHNVEVELSEMIANEKDLQPHFRKDNKIAEEQRVQGNAYFRDGNWSMAMAYYNDSLRFVESDSDKLMSFAYANRSSCFLQLKMYDKCLKDIDLAVAAGYPKNQMSKLKKRRAECEQCMELGEPTHSIGAKLSFEPDRNFPSMANVLRVEIDDTTGNAKIIAKRDIDVDRTIVVEDALFPYLWKQFGWKCNVCLKGYENLMPCQNCAAAMLCSGCQGNSLHGYECGLNMCGEGQFNRDALHEARKILSIVNMFASIDELMAFVEEHRQSSYGPDQLKQIPTRLCDIQSKFQVFLNGISSRKSKSNYENFDIDSMISLVYAVYRTVLQVPQIRAMFQTQKRLRFLMHLIGHNTLIPANTARFGSIRGTKMPQDDDLAIADGHHQMSQYFQHSCYPNALSTIGNGQQIIVTARPLKAGEQLFFSRIPLAIEPTKERRKHIRDEIDVKCKCDRCNGIMAEPMQRQNLSDDPVYRDLLSKIGQPNPNERGKAINDDCVMLLQKYGRINWCSEIKMVLQWYQGLLYNRFAGDVIKKPT